MNSNHENRYCQSCGMPLSLLATEYLGTDADHSPSSEYCYYCLKDGKYIVDYTMQQMIDVWVKYTDKYNNYAHTNHSGQELREILLDRLPALKRWKQRELTENVHFGIINRIQIYINQYLFDSLESDSLAQMACLSPYHFRRVFKKVTGENVGAYIQRLRLEYIAYKLISTDAPLITSINSTVVYNKHSISKAFRKHFGMSPTEYRKRFGLPGAEGHTPTENTRSRNLFSRIEKLDTKQVLALQVRDTASKIHSYSSLWQYLIQFREEAKLNGKENTYISLSLDDPGITTRNQCRFYLGIVASHAATLTGEFALLTVPANRYAVFRYKGPYTDLPEIYRDIYLNWFPSSGYVQSEPLTFELYLNTPREVPAEDLITDIYIPVQKY